MGTAPFEGFDLSLLWALPFAGFLLALAFLPLLKPQLWHSHDFKIALGTCAVVIIPMFLSLGKDGTATLLYKTMVHHYVPFIFMIGCLFIISGGIHITTSGHAKPLTNVIFLFTSGLLASIIGTTGASMLLIRPFLNLNHDRRHKAYLVIFFIFIVSNIGGCLSPIGDPPLFLGFLEGVDFFWPTLYLWKPFLGVILPLLAIFYFFDRHHYHHKRDIVEKREIEKFNIYGKRNLFLLGATIGLLLLTGIDPEKMHLWRDGGLVVIALLSYTLTPKNVHHMNRLSFEPLREVSIVFLTIFITLIPIEAMLHGGRAGAFGEMIDFGNPGGYSDPLRYYFITGALSAFLDNAPTYLLFFHMAGGDPQWLMEGGAKTLTAISTGAVFMGAITYIGNAPNFMVKSIAEKLHIRMPGFLGYMLWSFGILLPVLVLFGLIYFR